MENPSDKEIKLFPFQDFEVVEIEEKVYKRKFVFQLKTIKGKDSDMLLAALSENDYWEWLDAF